MYICTPCFCLEEYEPWDCGLEKTGDYIKCCLMGHASKSMEDGGALYDLINYGGLDLEDLEEKNLF